MPKVIYRYPLDITSAQAVKVPLGAEVLTVQMQAGTLQMWVLVDQDVIDLALEEYKTIGVFGTGHSMPDECKKSTYINTFQIGDSVLGGLVFHAFDLGEE